VLTAICSASSTSASELSISASVTTTKSTDQNYESSHVLNQGNTLSAFWFVSHFFVNLYRIKGFVMYSEHANLSDY
jgi:hypothetical protein